MKKTFPSFDSSPLSLKKESKRKKNNSACNLDDLVRGAQAKITKYATKYAVNVFKVIFAFNYYNKILKITFCFFFKCTIKLNENSMLQTANVLKSNFTRPIGCRVLAVKCSKNDHLNLEECTRQFTRMMDLMPSDFVAVNSTLPACAMIPNQQNFTRHEERFNSRLPTSLSRAIKCSDIHLEVLSLQNRKFFFNISSVFTEL